MQGGVAAAGMVQEGDAVGRVLVDGGQEDRPFVHGRRPVTHDEGDVPHAGQSALSGGITPNFFRIVQEARPSGASPAISRRSQARANAQSRSAVLGDTPRNPAASGMESPAK